MTKKKKAEQEAPGKPGINVYVDAFLTEYSQINRNLEKLATVYVEAKADYPDFDTALNAKLYIPAEFLQALKDIADKKLHPSVFLLSRGFTRLYRMPYADQATLIDHGLVVLRGDKSWRLRLSQMTDADILQVVTSQGRVRTVAEQLAYRKQLMDATENRTKRERIARRHRFSADAKPDKEYMLLDGGVRFLDTNKIWSFEELRQMLAVWTGGKALG